MNAEEKKAIKEVLPLLEKVAKDDQGGNLNLPWSYTDNCYYCGGTGAFIEWLKREVK